MQGDTEYCCEIYWDKINRDKDVHILMKTPSPDLLELHASSEDCGNWFYNISKDISKFNLLEINTLLSTEDSSNSPN